MLTTLRLISELERSADLVVNVCKASRRIYDVEFGPQLRGLIEQMGVEATFLIRAAIDSYVDADTVARRPRSTTSTTGSTSSRSTTSRRSSARTPR